MKKQGGLSFEADMNLCFHNLVNVTIINAPPKVKQLVVAEISPHLVQEISKSDLVFKFVDKLPLNAETANLSFMGGYSNAFFIKDYNHNKILIPFEKLGGECEILVETKFDKTLFFSILELLVQCKILNKKAMFVHSSGLEHRGEGIIFIAWKGTGKTRVLLEMLEKGASYAGDDWVILSENGFLFPYFKAPRLYETEVREQQLLLSKKTLAERINIKAFIFANRFLKILPAPVSSGIKMAVYSVRKMKGYSKQSGITQLAVDNIKKAKEVRLSKVFLLKRTTGKGVVIKKAKESEINSVCEKIISATRYETFDLFEYYLMFKFSFPDKSSPLIENSNNLMKQILKKALRGKDIYFVDFPQKMDLLQLRREFLDVFFS